MNALLGCDPSAIDIKVYWDQIDKIAYGIDRALCSKDCSCNLYNKTGYTTGEAIESTYSLWDITGPPENAIKFQNCSETVQRDVQYSTANYTAFSNFTQSIKLWAVFERNFKCSGWCNMTYDNYKFDKNNFTCYNEDLTTPCNCTAANGGPCDTCVDVSDKKSKCTSYERPLRSIEKYLLYDINK